MNFQLLKFPYFKQNKHLQASYNQRSEPIMAQNEIIHQAPGSGITFSRK